MNGILHNAARKAPTKKKLFFFVYRELDMLFKNVARPTKYVFIAVDGPASLAKARTQRARRATKKNSLNNNNNNNEPTINNEIIENNIVDIDHDIDDNDNIDDIDDDNDDENQKVEEVPRKAKKKRKPPAVSGIQITPGVLFMEELTDALEFYVMSRLANDRKFFNVQFVLSSSSVAGQNSILLFLSHKY